MQSWPDDRVAPGGAECSGGWGREGRPVEPIRGVALRARPWVTDQVRAVVEFARPTHVTVQKRRDRQSARPRINPADLPASGQSLRLPSPPRLQAVEIFILVF